MLSKHNFKECLRKMEDKQDRFSIRKFSIGAVSVLIGSFIFGIQSPQTVKAETLSEKNNITLTRNKEITEKDIKNTDNNETNKVNLETDNQSVANSKVTQIVKEKTENVSEVKKDASTQLTPKANNNKVKLSNPKIATKQQNLSLNSNSPESKSKKNSNDHQETKSDLVVRTNTSPQDKKIENTSVNKPKTNLTTQSNSNDENHRTTNIMPQTHFTVSMDKSENNTSGQKLDVDKNTKSKLMSSGDSNIDLAKVGFKDATNEKVPKLNVASSINSLISINKNANNNGVNLQKNSAHSLNLLYVTNNVKNQTLIEENKDVSISDAPNYPDTHGVVPTSQYIFDQFTLTNGQLTNDAYTPLNMVITLTTDRSNPGSILNYYITNNDYSKVYDSNIINVGENITYTGEAPYPSSNLIIYNFGQNGISVNENNNNFGLAFTFGYGKYDSMIKSNDPNPFSSSNVSNAWGDTIPTQVTQTISYIDAQTNEPMAGVPSIHSTGLTGQIYQVNSGAEKVIKGYYLINKEKDHGIISQYKTGGVYTNEWVSQSGQLIKEVWHQLNSEGVMQADIYINNKQQYDPQNPKGIVYPSTMSTEGPTQLNIDNGSYIFPNPYVEQTSNIELKYDPLGHIIPVTSDGTPIPNAPTPQYTNNPTNPSAVEPNEPVPNIPGYTPEVSTVTPTDPGTDTKVIYVPIEQGSITVTVHDVTDNVNLPQYGKSSGEQDVGTGFTYDKNTVITDLENKGYKVLNPDVVIPTTISKGAQNIVINVEHQLVPVTPENPGTPGQPINPNDPDGPKWPDGTAKNDLEATGSQTIHYEGAGNKTPSDNIQHFTFTKSATVDKVTGKIVSETGWNVSSHTFGNVDTPIVAGYHADKAVAGGTTITPDDLNKTIVVTYAPNGHVIPVGPDGQPIPNAPQPQFPTNPDNPTGTTPSEVPVVPGYHPETGKPGDPVDPVPGKPGENVPVKYVPDTPTPETYNGSQTIKFVDGTTGKEIESPNVQTATNLTGDHTFGKINTPVIKGYTTTETTAGGATVTKNNPNAVITVTYIPNGHIIPVGPDGKPIPGADQPQFPTSPNNPSETTPGQVPDVPGYHPENRKPGEPVNPVPGKPGENVPVKYVPNSQTPSTSEPETPNKPSEGTPGTSVPQTPHIPSKENPSKESNIPKRNSNGINPNEENISNGSNSNRVVSENSNKEISTPIRKTSLQLANRTKAEEIELNKKNAIHNISQESTNSRTRTLPKTGNKSNETLSVIGLSILGLSVLFGLMDRKKRRN